MAIILKTLIKIRLKYLLNLFICLLSVQYIFSQENNLGYKEDQFYLGVSYFMQIKDIEDFKQNGFSGNFQAGFIKDISLDELEFLNPAYKINVIPKVDGRTYHLVLPIDKMGVFVANEKEIYAHFIKLDAEKRKNYPKYSEEDERVVHRVKSGEYLGKSVSYTHLTLPTKRIV